MNLSYLIEVLVNGREKPNPPESKIKKQLVPTGKYVKDLANYYKGSKNKKKDEQELEYVLSFLRNGSLPPKEFNNPHKIHHDFWDIHIGSANSDWLLIVEISNTEVKLVATGSHSYLDKFLHT